MEWNAALYDAKHGFVAAYGEDLLRLIPRNPAQTILDLGCGTGTLTARLAHLGGRVVGVDSSPDMVNKARAAHAGIEFLVCDALSLPFRAEWNVIFSNAVFHWIEDHAALLFSIRNVLRPGGLLVCEFGAQGNIAAIEGAFSRALEKHGIPYRSRLNFPAAEQFRAALHAAGFSVDALSDFDRPTPLKDGEHGLSAWLRQFFAADLGPLPQQAQDDIIRATEDSLREALWNGHEWVADYRRLRAVAHAPSAP